MVKNTMLHFNGRKTSISYNLSGNIHSKPHISVLTTKVECKLPESLFNDIKHMNERK